MSDEEEKYIKQQEADRLARERRQRQLEALKLEERDGIAAVLGSSDEVANEALELGFDRETARILHLVPVIQVAWADGKISGNERDKVLELAEQRGVEDGTPAREFLELLLSKQPSDLFFERTNRVISHLLRETGKEAERDDILARARAVAEASGGFFGLTSSVSDEERQLIDDLAEIFSAT